jgi:hypothetical protein
VQSVEHLRDEVEFWYEAGYDFVPLQTGIRTLAPGGGYCVGSSSSVTAYVPRENFNAMREAAFRYGRYPLGG